MKGKNYERVLIFIACTITVLFGITIIVHEIFPSHPVPSGLTNVMIIVATGFFGAGVATNIRRSKNGDNDESN